MLSAMAVVIGTAAAGLALYPIKFDGYIKDANGNPVSYEGVEITRGGYTWSGVTDQNGYYSTGTVLYNPPELKEGYYVMVVRGQSKTEYIDASRFVFHTEGYQDCYDLCSWDRNLDPSEIPEFSTIAIPIAMILGLLFFFNRRKHRKE